MVDVSGTSSWTYNAADEITDLNTPQGDVDYTYNLAGQILTLVDVGTGTTTNTYDSAGRPATTTDAFGDVSSYSYDSAGRLSQKNNPNGTYEVYSYDSRNRVTSIVTKNSSNAVLQSRVYTFDLASQVTQVVEGGVTTTYGYDNIGQLTSESKSSGYSGAYTYDANGNRLTRTVNSVTENYSYDSADKLTGITGGSDARTFTYDAAGRTTGIVRSSGTTAFSYDYESRVTSITKPGMTTNSFSYNGLDTRVGLVDSSGTKSFKRAEVGVTAPVLSDGTANFTPSGEKRGSVKTTFHSALKNDDVQTSSTQVVSAAKQFDAFGNELLATGSWKSQFGYAGRFGYQSDPDSGLKLLGHRYYDSDTGRFLTRDPAKDGRNWYGYCGNNPIASIDPSGLKWHDPLILYVDPDFDGYVEVTGEAGPGEKPGVVRLYPGQSSDPRMDVDYVLVFKRNRPKLMPPDEYFLWGEEWDYDFKDVTQYARIDKNGRPKAKGLISNENGITYPIWGSSHSDGRNNDLSRRRPPRNGIPQPKTIDPPSGPRTNPYSGGQIDPIGTNRIGGNLVWE